MHHPGIFHPCRQNLLGRDASPQDFSSLQTESPRQGYIAPAFSSLQTEFPRQGSIAPGFFIPADKISSAGMHRSRIFHPCRQNLLVRDAPPQDFSSLQTESPRQGCIATAFFIPADKIFSAGMHRPRIFHPCRQNLLVRDASSPQLCPKLAAPPQSAELASIHLNACRADPDKAGSSDFQTAGFHSR